MIIKLILSSVIILSTGQNLVFGGTEGVSGCCRIRVRVKPPTIRIAPPRVTIAPPQVTVPNPIQKIPEVVGNVVENVAREAGRAIQNTQEEAGKGLHNSGKTIGDGVKELRNTISSMQGLDVEKQLAEIRGQIQGCQQNTAKLSLIKNDITELKAYVSDLTTTYPGLSLEELNDRVLGKVKSMDRLSNGAGTALTVGSTVTSMSLMMLEGATGAAAANLTWAAWAGGYTAAAALIVIAMTTSASKEVAHENKKLKACGEQYQAAFVEVNAVYSSYLEVLETNKTAVKEFNGLMDQYSKLLIAYLSYSTEGPEAFDLRKLLEMKEAFIIAFDAFIGKYPGHLKEDQVKSVRDEIASMEIQ